MFQTCVQNIRREGSLIHIFVVILAVVTDLCYGYIPNKPLPAMEILFKYFGSSHCLIHLTEYKQNHHWSTLRYPIIIRNLRFIRWSSCYYGMTHDQTKPCEEWIPSFWEGEKICGLINQNLTCTSGTYFNYDLNSRHGLCFVLKFKQMVLKSKPWNCELHIHMSLPTDLFVEPPAPDHYRAYRKLVYPPVWFFHGDGSLDYPVPSAIPEYILLLTFQAISNEYSKKSLISWIQHVQGSFLDKKSFRKYDTSNIRLLYMNIYKPMQLLGYILEDMHKHILELVLGWEYGAETHRRRLAKLNFATLNQTQLPIKTEIARQSALRTTGLKILQLNFIPGTEERYLPTIFKRCRVKRRLAKLWHTNWETEDFASQLLVDLWLSIFGNYSYAIYEDGLFVKSCANGKFKKRNIERDETLELTIFSDNSFQPTNDPYPILLRDDHYAMRFITCGTSDKDRPMFEELLLAFDQCTWQLLLFSIFCFFLLTLISLPCYSTTNALERILDVFAILLEKPSPIITKLKQKHPFMAMLFCTTMGLVMSNGYRNTNVYNLSQPRPRQPLSYLFQLLEKTYSVYSRAFQLTFDSSSIDQVERNHLIVVYNYSSNISFYSSIHVTSEVWSLRNDGIGQLAVQSEIFPVANTLLYDALNANSEIHSGTLYEFIQQDLLELQMMHINKELCSCNKTAFVLPQFRCDQVKSEMADNCPYQLAISVGNDRLSYSSIVFMLTGLIPSHIIVRLQLSKETGIWHWIISVTRRVPDTSLPKLPVAAQLYGNIIIVFALFMTGVLICITSVFLEIIMHKWGKSSH